MFSCPGTNTALASVISRGDVGDIDVIECLYRGYVGGVVGFI